MIEVAIIDSSTATIDGKTVTGPQHVFGSSCTDGALTYSRGYIVVDSGGMARVMPLTANQMETLPYGVVLGLLLGLIAGKFGHY